MLRVLKALRTTWNSYLSRSQSKRARSDQQIGELLEIMFRHHGDTNGLRRLAAARRQEYGIEVKPRCVHSLVKTWGLKTLTLTKRYKRPRGEQEIEAKESLIQRNCTPWTPGMPSLEAGKWWCGDITYIRTGDGRSYVATAICLDTRQVLACVTADHMRTELGSDTRGSAA